MKKRKVDDAVFQEMLNELEADGLIEQHIKLTEKGIAWLSNDEPKPDNVVELFKNDSLG